MASAAPALAPSEGLSSQPAMTATFRPAKVGVIYNIQALRAVVTLMIVAIHGSAVLGVGENLVFHSFTAGVDVFFVISGLLMVLLTNDGRDTPLSFAKARIRRVAPLYWLITLVTFGAVLAQPDLFKATRADIGELIQSLLFIPFVKSNGELQPMLFVGWTLNYEMLFYSIFAGAMFLKGSGPRIAAASGAMIALAVLGAVLPPGPTALAFLTHSLILEFVGGMILGLLLTRSAMDNRWFGLWTVAAGTTLVVVFSAYLPDWPRVLKHGAPAVLIVAGAVMADRGGWKITYGPLRLFGEASFALYLTHVFVVGLADRFAPPEHVLAIGAKYILTIAAAAAVGVIVHKAVEKPLGRMLGRRTRLDLPPHAGNAWLGLEWRPNRSCFANSRIWRMAEGWLLRP